MADEPDNLVLQLLREIRGKAETIDHRLIEVEKQIKSLNMKTTYLMGLSTDADFRAQTATDATDELTSKIDAVILRVEALEGAH